MVDFEFYTTKYRGMIIPETSFASYEVQAEAEVNMLTYGRDAGEEIDRYKKAICNVADVLYRIDNEGKQGELSNVKSMSSGGQSVSFRDSAFSSASADVNFKNTLIYDTAAKWLGVTGLMWGGI